MGRCITSCSSSFVNSLGQLTVGLALRASITNSQLPLSKALYVYGNMSIHDLAKSLSQIDEPEQWVNHIPSSYSGTNKAVFRIAEPLWVQRMISQNALYIHPNVIRQLKKQSFVPTDLQNKMIWASILASSDDSNRKSSIKKLVKKKYGFTWWEDAYSRTRKMWIAKERINKKLGANGSGMNALISNTHLFGNAAQSEIEAALKEVPET